MTIAVCTTMKPTNAQSPRKCTLRAPCLPPKSFPYQGKRASTEGDIPAPLAICSGANKKIIPK